jgi:hypothetical protein
MTQTLYAIGRLISQVFPHGRFHFPQSHEILIIVFLEIGFFVARWLFYCRRVVEASPTCRSRRFSAHRITAPPGRAAAIAADAAMATVRGLQRYGEKQGAARVIRQVCRMIDSPRAMR